ncbi:hypothetical protein ACVTME_20390, partial [Escherichia coli]
SVGMVLANRCHRQNMKTSIINGSEVSRLSVAIQSGDKLRATKSVWSVILFISDFVIHGPNFSTPAFAVNEALMTKAKINFLITLSPWI